jgi:hypothetical protein
MPRSITAGLTWAVPVIALLMLALTVTPAEVWNHPVSDATYRGFDPNFVYTSSGGSGVVNVSSSSIELTAKPRSDPTVILATTPLQRFQASLDVTIQANEGAAMPFAIGLWSAASSAAYFVVFEAGPENLITAQTITDAGSGFTLVSGTVLSRTKIGSYKLGDSYRVAFLLDKAGGSLTSRVFNPDGTSVAASVDSRQSPKLFLDLPLALSASASAGEGSSQVVLRDYSVNLPHERLWASKVADPRASFALVGLAIIGALLVLIAIAPRILTGYGSVAGRVRKWPADLLRRLASAPGQIVLLFGSIAVYLAGNAWLFRLGGHPFDLAAEKLYAYVARSYGPSQLYFLPNIVGLPKIWQGVPRQETPFPYEPVMAYLSTGIGWLSSVLFGGGMLTADSLQLEYLVKAVNVLFGLADAALIYWILRQIGMSNRWSLVAGGLFLFNPAVWFSMSVWGETHVVSLFFVLAAILLAEKRLPVWAWLALAAACLTRPQMFVFGLLLGVVFLRKFSWRENILALSWTVILMFIALIPFTLATSPSLPVDITANIFRVHEATSSNVVTTVSQDTYSIWPLVEYLVQGASGQQQAFNPKNVTLVGPITYQSLSQALTLAVMLALAGFLFFRRRVSGEAGAYIPYLAIGITAFLMLLFSLVASHFVLALPFLLLSRRWMGAVAYFYVAVIWTATTFVTMYGDMGRVIFAHDYPLLAPANNAITNFVVGLYTNDRFITVGIVANILVVLWLVFLTLGPTRSAPARSAA